MTPTPMQCPLVTVLITNYNYARFLSRAIESALRQTYARVEVVVVDDGSTDGSRAVLTRYAGRVTVMCQPNGWQASAFNVGFATARGEIVLLLDADDVLLLDTAERVVEAFTSQPSAAKVHYRLENIDEDGVPTGATTPSSRRRLPSGDLRRQIVRHGGYVHAPTSGNAFAAWALRRIGPLPEERHGMWPDDFLARAAGLLGPVVALDGVGAQYRIHGDNAYVRDQLHLDWARGEIGRTTTSHDHLRRLAKRFGVRGYPSHPRDIRNPRWSALRMVSLKFDRPNHPLLGDSLWNVAARGAWAALLNLETAPRQKLLWALWFSAMALLPAAFARRIAVLPLVPAPKVAAPRRNARVVYLSPTYYPYRVPVFDALHRQLPGGLTVVTLARQATPNDRLAQGRGAFRRRLVRGFQLSLSRGHETGRETPFGLLATPLFPLILLALRPRVVLSNNFNLWTLSAVVLRRRTIIVWEGTAHTERTVSGVRLWSRRWVARRADGFVVNGRLSHEYVTEQLGVAPERVGQGGMCPEAPPTGACRTPRQVSSNETIRFLFCGNLIQRKGVAHLIRAVALLHRCCDRPFELTILGDGPERGRLERLTCDLAVVGWVRFAGTVAPERVWDYYAQAHVLVVPTVQDNWPLVVPEAMSVGLPILLSCYAGSAPDMIEEGGNGHVFDPSDHARLAELMHGYIAEPRRVSCQGARSLELAAAYTPERCAAMYVDAIRRVMEPDSMDAGYVAGTPAARLGRWERFRP